MHIRRENTTHEVGLEVLALQEVAAEIGADGEVLLARVHFGLERLVVAQEQLHAGHVPRETSSSHIHTRMDNQRASPLLSLCAFRITLTELESLVTTRGRQLALECSSELNRIDRQAIGSAHECLEYSV